MDKSSQSNSTMVLSIQCTMSARKALMNSCSSSLGSSTLFTVEQPVRSMNFIKLLNKVLKGGKFLFGILFEKSVIASSVRSLRLRLALCPVTSLLPISGWYGNRPESVHDNEDSYSIKGIHLLASKPVSIMLTTNTISNRCFSSSKLSFSRSLRRLLRSL